MGQFLNLSLYVKLWVERSVLIKGVWSSHRMDYDEYNIVNLVRIPSFHLDMFFSKCKRDFL